MKLELKIQPKHRTTAFVLEMGGYFLPPFTGARIILVDRNVISNCKNILNQGSHKDNYANQWWFSFLNNENFLLNPLLCAIEGANFTLSNFEEFCREVDDAYVILKKFFPAVSIPIFSGIHYEAGYSLLRDVTASYEADLRFLLKAVPLILEKHKVDKCSAIEDKLFTLAEECLLPRPTLALLACLSCLYEGNAPSHLCLGRKVIKPKQNYSEKNAHNALMDLVALSLLVQGNAKLVERVGLCTGDMGLVRFWCGLKVSPDGKTDAKGFTVTIELNAEMLPALSEEGLLNLKQRLSAYNFG